MMGSVIGEKRPSAPHPPAPRTRREPAQEIPVAHAATTLDLRALGEKAGTVQGQPSQSLERSSLDREAAPDDDRVPAERREERRTEVLFPRVVDPEEEAVLDGVEVRDGRHLAAAFREVAPAVPRPCGGHAASRPAAAPQAPGEVHVLA